MNMMRIRITIRAQKDNSLIIDGLAYLEDVAEKLDVDFGDVEFETLNGYLTSILGHIPTKKDIDTTIKAERILLHHSFYWQQDHRKGESREG